MRNEASLHTLLATDGAVAPPRRNGELLFQAPWESRVFGIAVALYQQGLFEWREFQQSVIAEIAAWERQHPDGAGWQYYERWQAALENLLARKGLCDSRELRARADELGQRPLGHDHR